MKGLHGLILNPACLNPQGKPLSVIILLVRFFIFEGDQPVARIYILIALAVIVVWLAVRYVRRKNIESQPPPNAADQQAKQAESEDMVRCAHCNVHLPKSESSTSQGKFFCSDEHRRLHLKN
jgi:uncharacterized protein